MSKKELLDKAFNEAVTEVNVNAMETDNITEEVLATSMRAFAEREKVDFTEDEIKATIIAGLETMKEVGKDFTYQTKMMP
ncbi:MAG: hypothetical protein ACI4LY_07975 [Candidatus Fimisoma sp.]|jgi:predicted DNA-binding ArsR family transcriptional regulator|nr:hypothetical protein [Bacillota bacterium]MDD7285605.1 hypothetical protein [Bacillota bacterium]MDY4747275.1 hypothetical protein [Candidatus Fimisoma sp.]